MKKWTLALIATGLTACTQLPVNDTSNLSAVPGVSFVEEQPGAPGKTAIPYKKYTLDNGLTLIIHQDHSDPLVHVDVTYHVGSAREELGKSGFAHFFEHMMFQGSENVADEQHFKLITEAGGQMNGTTNSDRTNYFQTVPASQLEKMLWLEADRMGFLLDAVTQEKFEVQRETVKNERGQRIDNRPYGRLNERISQALYPDGHPYSWPVIGYMDDLNRVNVNDLKAFFLRWYGPNNATLTIGGDVNVEQTLALVNKYFGSIPRGEDVKMPEKPPVTLDADRYISMEDNVHLPLIYMSFPTASGRHEDEAPLDLLAEILGGGKTSLLYKNLVKNRQAVQASASHPCAELACTFDLLALPIPGSGKTLADMEKVIRDSINEFEQRGVTDDDLIKAKAKMEASFIFGLQSVRGKVSQLAANQTFTGNPNYIEQDIARYNNVTRADVMRVFKQYIQNKPAVIMSIVPKGQTQLIAREDNFTPPARDFSELPSTTADQLQYRRATDSFDRSIQPAASDNKPVAVPDYWQQTMDNGLQILGSVSTETPTTSLLLRIPGGHYAESTNKAGMASLTAAMLNEATKDHSTEAMSKALQKLGSRISISAGNHYTSVYISSLSKNLNPTLALLEEKLFEPAFHQADFERLKQQTLEGIANNKKDPGYLSRTAYSKLLFGDNIAGLPKDGTLASVAELTLADVKGFYQRHLKPYNAQLIVVSDLAEQQLREELTVLNKWQGKGPELTLELPVPAHEADTIYLVDKPGAAQSAIRLGKRGLKKDITGEFFRANLMNFPLGGNFNSRINLNLREDKGYTYGARTGFWGDKLAGGFTAAASVRADVTDKSLLEFVKEITSYHQQGISDSELAFMRKAINQKDALKYETPNAKLSFLARILEHKLTPEFVKQQSKIVESISADEVNALASKHLNIKDMQIVIVGDATTLRPQLKALGYQVKDINI